VVEARMKVDAAAFVKQDWHTIKSVAVVLSQQCVISNKHPLSKSAGRQRRWVENRD
jgi:hypothetical protein